jgi:hypothetical protein
MRINSSGCWDVEHRFSITGRVQKARGRKLRQTLDKLPYRYHCADFAE